MQTATIFTVLTTAATTAPSVGAYALWYTVTADSRDNTVTLRNPVTITDTTAEQSIPLPQTN